MLPTCVNRLSPQTISRVTVTCLPLLGGQNGGEGDNMRVRLRLVRRIGWKGEVIAFIQVTCHYVGVDDLIVGQSIVNSDA